MTPPVARVKLRWLATEEGGRKRLPEGSVYATTARFAADPEDRLFSVVLHLPHRADDKQRIHEADLNVLFWERLPEVCERLVQGSQLLVTEGSRVVAESEVLSVSREPVESH